MWKLPALYGAVITDNVKKIQKFCKKGEKAINPKDDNYYYEEYEEESEEEYSYDSYDSYPSYPKKQHRWRNPLPWILLFLIALGIAVLIGVFNWSRKSAQLSEKVMAEYTSTPVETSPTEPGSTAPEESVPTPTESMDGKTLSNFEEVMSLINQKSAKGEKIFTIYCTPELYESLQQERAISPLSTVMETPLDEILENCSGTTGYIFTCYELSNKIDIEITRMLAGFEIVAAWRNGTTDALPETERKTYEVAESMVSELRKDTDIGTAYAIHDWLCNHVTYTVDESTENDDCAIGAILYGQANCDGYADAFYLLGTMMGLEVRIQSGDADSPSLDETNTAAGHMWNLLKIEGEWHHVDVTWDDGNDGDLILYCWFNVGSDTMKKTHYWHSDTTVEIAADTDLSTRPSNEYHIWSVEDFQTAVSDAVSRNLPIAYFVFESEELYAYKDNLPDYLANSWFYASYSYMEIDEMQTLVFIP